MGLQEFDHPDRFVVGTVGEPGERTFFLQASEGERVMSVSMEKQQVSVLGQRIIDLLDEVADASATGEALPDNAPLDTPIEDSFRVTTLSLGWDTAKKVIIVECHDSDVDTSTGELMDPLGESMRVVVEPAIARAFAKRCETVVAAGRQPCPFCGGPLEVEGHVCPRANGYRR